MKGIQLAVADANAHGGWLGRKLELKVYDDQSNPGTGVRLYTRLITQDNVDLVDRPLFERHQPSSRAADQ